MNWRELNECVNSWIATGRKFLLLILFGYAVFCTIASGTLPVPNFLDKLLCKLTGVTYTPPSSSKTTSKYISEPAELDTLNSHKGLVPIPFSESDLNLQSLSYSGQSFSFLTHAISTKSTKTLSNPNVSILISIETNTRVVYTYTIYYPLTIN